MRNIMTRNARSILEINNNSKDHLTVEQIYNCLKEKNKVVLATVYNNLSYLCEQGLIRKISVDGYSDRYDKIEKHDHLICKKCGKISDIMLEDLTSKLQNQTDISILSYELKLNYICDECLDNENPSS